MIDNANGYEENAHHFLRARNSRIGPDVVAAWAVRFPRGAQILELGCGFGVISQVLLDAGLALSANDASPALLRVFRERFPHVETECATAENSTFFTRTYDGIVAWGLLFLLEESFQRRVLTQSAGALRHGGRLLFTAPREIVQWNDSLTGHPSFGLGSDFYESLLRDVGLTVEPGVFDSGENYYYFATRPPKATN
jgi:SAM-dependent methyltransferase